ncbi:hypothetical protein BD408DRAFT_413649 [Parasitella parasitica]|nr:hypothetical protein BD408DRAFT_413649 [Parasitella parasitica]
MNKYIHIYFKNTALPIVVVPAVGVFGAAISSDPLSRFIQVFPFFLSEILPLFGILQSLFPICKG